MYPIREFEGRFREILAALDALSDNAPDADAAEALEEICAEFEDALILLVEIRAEDGDWRESLTDALEEFEALAEDCRALRLPEADGIATRLEMVARMAAANVEDANDE